MRPLLILALLVVFLSACGDDRPSAATKTISKPPATKAVPPTPTEEELLDDIRSEYELIAREMQAAALTADSIDYSCEEQFMDGRIMSFSSEGETRVIISSYAQGDHFGVTEYWYFRDEEPFFLLREYGGWSFGGPGETDEEGNEYPSSIDDVTEQRYYIAGGKVIRQLEKSYQVKSWLDENPAETAQNTEVATTGSIPVTYEWLQNSLREGRVACASIPDREDVIGVIE